MSVAPDLEAILRASSWGHSHLCPRQVLGARMGLAGLRILEVPWPLSEKRVLIVAETDGCFLDGLSAATDCTPGHRTLRIEDYGKTAATFVDTLTDRAIRVAPAMDLRTQAMHFAPDEHRTFHAQLKAYQVIPDEAMFSVAPVVLKTPVATIISRPKVRVTCSTCGEDIINEREVHRHGQRLCRNCAQGGYYAVMIPGQVQPL